jgi:hypothetical protein
MKNSILYLFQRPLVAAHNILQYNKLDYLHSSHKKDVKSLSMYVD